MTLEIKSSWFHTEVDKNILSSTNKTQAIDLPFIVCVLEQYTSMLTSQEKKLSGWKLKFVANVIQRLLELKFP